MTSLSSVLETILAILEVIEGVAVFVVEDGGVAVVALKVCQI